MDSQPNIIHPKVILMGSTLAGASVQSSRKSIADLANVFEDKEAVEQMRQTKTIYEVDSYCPVSNGSDASLAFEIIRIQPGLVGDEYFMTEIHLQAAENCVEFYWGIQGEGMLIVVDKNRNTWAERMHPGSIHHVTGWVALRVANFDEGLFTFGACRPTDSIHAGEQIEFSKRLKKVHGVPELI